MIIDLKNKQGLVIGIANEQSIAYGCAEQFREANAELAITFKGKAEPYVRPLAVQLKSPLFSLVMFKKKKRLLHYLRRFKKNGERWISCCTP